MTIDVAKLANRVLAGFDARPQHVTWEEVEALSIADAYLIQHQVTLQRESRGETRIGYKVGCTSKAIQRQIQIYSPIWGSLFHTDQHTNHSRFSISRFARLAVEGELAVTLDRDPRDLDLDKPLDAVDTAFPVIELHNFEIPDSSKNASVLIANNAMHAGFVRQNPEYRTQQPISDLSLTIGDETLAMVGASKLRETIENSLSWLASTLHGNTLLRRLDPPVTVLCGSVAELIPVSEATQVKTALLDGESVDCILL